MIFLITATSFSYAQKGNAWSKKNYNVTGTWSIEKDGESNYLVLGSDFKTSKGPDLKLFVSKKAAQSIGKNEAVEKNSVFIADLKSNKGAQRYLLPSNVTISDFKSIVVHCEKYTKVWAASSI